MSSIKVNSIQHSDSLESNISLGEDGGADFKSIRTLSIKHPNSSYDNLVLNSDGTVRIETADLLKAFNSLGPNAEYLSIGFDSNTATIESISDGDGSSRPIQIRAGDTSGIYLDALGAVGVGTGPLSELKGEGVYRLEDNVTKWKSGYQLQSVAVSDNSKLTLSRETINDINFNSSEYSNVLYVDAEEGSDDEGAGSEGAPYATIQKALNESENNDAIKIAPGVYTEILTIPGHTISIFGSGVDTEIVSGFGSGGDNVVSGTAGQHLKVYGLVWSYGGRFLNSANRLMEAYRTVFRALNDGNTSYLLYNNHADNYLENCVIYSEDDSGSSNSQVFIGGKIELKNCYYKDFNNGTTRYSNTYNVTNCLIRDTYVASATNLNQGSTGEASIDEDFRITLEDWEDSDIGVYYGPYRSDGYRISQPLFVGDIMNVANSNIEWEFSSNESTSLTIKSAITDSHHSPPPLDSQHWQVASNNNSIPEADSGSNLLNKSLWVMQEVHTDDTSITPELENLLIEISGGEAKGVLQLQNSEFAQLSIATDRTQGNIGSLSFFDGDHNLQGNIVASTNGSIGFRSGFEEHVSITGTGQVGVGTTHPNYALEVGGSFAASAKSFDIPDPRYSSDNKRLVHGSLEGPELGVYYRGSGALRDGEAEIALPEYFEYLTRKGSRTIQLTARGSTPFSLSASDIVSGKFTIFSSSKEGSFDWEVKAIRADQPELGVEVVRNT